MTLEEALKTALSFEKRVHQTYLDAVSLAKDAVGRRVFKVLAREELGHISYLEHCLVQWKEKGRLDAGKLETAIPDAAKIKSGLRKLKQKIGNVKTPSAAELDLLRKALDAENETAAFYRNTVSGLPAEGQALFSKFILIEEGHGALVQAEITSIEHGGFWHDIREFDLESA